MKLSLLSVLSLASAQSPSATRHFIGLYDSPLGQRHLPFPVDRCINVAVDLSGTSYGVYSCSDDLSTVTYTHYDDDASCTDSSQASAGGVYTMDGLQAGDLFAFNCDGSDSFIELKSMINDDTCCNGSPAFTSVATGVCHIDATGQYILSECGETSATQRAYSDRSCQTLAPVPPLFELFADQCLVFDSAFAVININSVLNRCVVDGSSLAEPSFCGEKSLEQPIGSTLAPPAVTGQVLPRRLLVSSTTDLPDELESTFDGVDSSTTDFLLEEEFETSISQEDVVSSTVLDILRNARERLIERRTRA